MWDLYSVSDGRLIILSANHVLILQESLLQRVPFFLSLNIEKSEASIASEIYAYRSFFSFSLFVSLDIFVH